MKHNTFLGGAIISSVPQINTKKKDRNNIQIYNEGGGPLNVMAFQFFHKQ